MRSRRLLLVGWDSADWKIIRPLMERGLMPTLSALVGGGVSGDLATLEPQLSPMLWTSIATGKMAYDHGVYGFTEVDSATGQVVPVSAATRRCKTVWEILGESGFKSHVVGWFATHGERDLNGCMVSNLYPQIKDAHSDKEPEEWGRPLDGTYWPEDLASSLDELRLAPFEMNGDQMLRLLVPDADRIDQRRDRRLWELAERLAEAYSIHAATTWLLENRPDWNLTAVYFRAIDEICHQFMPFHPPQMTGVSDEDFALYRGVVEGAYRLHDLMLARLIELAGADTAVMLISDHGFHSDHLRPRHTPNVPAGITVWHRRQGIFAASGGAFATKGEVFGATLLDLAPTILHYFGLPMGDDMEGRVLSEAFRVQWGGERVPTWESAESAQRKRVSLSAKESEEMLQQFVALGYINPLAEDPADAAIETERENKWNLARACVYGGRFEEALPLMEDCVFEFPERLDFLQLLVQIQTHLELWEEASETLQMLLEESPRTMARIIEARLELKRGNDRRALELLESLDYGELNEPELLFSLARANFNNRRWKRAEELATAALAIDPTQAESHLIRARCALRRKEPKLAEEAALEAIHYQFGEPRGHFYLGIAYTQQGLWKEAETALSTHLQLRPRHPAGLRYLAHVYRELGDHAKAVACEAVFETHETEADKVSKAEKERRRSRLREEARERTTRREAARAARRARETSVASHLEPTEFVLVSGLPRSGTSLMMQILAAGGLPPMTDGEREADADNPEGYYEWEAIKSLPHHPWVIEEAQGRVVKVISALLPALPAKHRYKIVFMRRPTEQVVRSQRTMLERNGQTPGADDAVLVEQQEAHLQRLLKKLREQPNIAVNEISFPELVANPAAKVEELCAFLGQPSLDQTAMAAAIRPELFRHRS